MKFFGKLGFWSDDVEASPGVWKPSIVEKYYTGDVLSNRRNFQSGDAQNGKFTISNRISVLSDLYIQQNWPSILYVLWKGTKWEVSNVEEDYPRINITIGGLYNENET